MECGVSPLSVRGIDKVCAQMGWYVLAHNLQRLLSLRQERQERQERAA